MLLHTIEGVTDVIYFFSGCKEEREVAELHMLFLRVTPTLPNTFINFAVLDRACFGDANIAGQERGAQQRPPPLHILRLSAWWWLHDFGSNGTCR